MNDPTIACGYGYSNADAAHTSAYLWEPVTDEILASAKSANPRVFDLGCGNGAFARFLKEKGCAVKGVDPSEEGIAAAKKADPNLEVFSGNAYEPLAEKFGQFPVVVSLEVVEHVYYPRKYAKCISDLLEPGGRAIVSTPYHSYFKNLVLALSGKMDAHFTALWDHGHIKFWSVDTLSQLFSEQDLVIEKVRRVGRVPVLAKSMILMFRKK